MLKAITWAIMILNVVVMTLSGVKDKHEKKEMKDSIVKDVLKQLKKEK